jgi:pimeloyl-ACP methyl ester carboxylesterase
VEGDAVPRGGSALNYDDHGDGPPVIYIHGGGDSHLSHPAETHGVRVIGVDRCGPCVRGRDLHSCAAEVLAVADELGLERFGVVGWSAGGPHALALAALAPERVDRISLVASMPPPDLMRHVHRDVRSVTRLARISPRLATRPLERWGRQPVPQLAELEHTAAYQAGRIDSFRDGGAWLAQELAYLSRPWGFELADVRAPVAVWWGSRDVVTRPPIAHAYVERLPNAELHLVDDGHQVLFSRWREILADAAPRTRP